MPHAARPSLPPALRRAAACLLASVALSAAAATATPPYAAGATSREAASASAALRNHGKDALRMLVWYPAAAGAVESPLQVGPPGKPIFLPGAVAAGAPWADANRHPLVLLSHGFGGSALQLTWLGSALARAGYVAIAVDHPGTNGVDGVTPAGAYAPWERAGDLALALANVLADPSLAPHLDAARVGVAGFSMGGFTAALLAGARPDLDRFAAFCASPQRDAICNPQKEFPLDYRQAAEVLSAPAMAPIAQRRHADWREPRVRAALLIAPALGQGVDPRSLAAIAIPLDVVYGDADAIVPPATNARLFAAAVPGSHALVLPGVGHYDFLSECGDFGREVAADYCRDSAAAPRVRTHAAAIAEALAFFDRTLAAAKP